MHTFRNLLADYFIRVNHLEALEQSIRQSLAKNPYFQYETIFERMDKFHQGYLVPADFSQFMLENKVYPNEKELYIVFRDFDTDRLGSVGLEKFALEILPKENQRLRREAISRKYYPSPGKLELDLEYLLTKLFEHKIKMHNELQELRVKLNQIYISYPEEAFSLVDRNKKLEIVPSDIDYFLRSSSKVLKSQQIHRIFKAVMQSKSDTDPNILTYDRFLDHIDPFARGFYVRYGLRLIEKNNLEKEFIARKVIEQQKFTMQDPRSLHKRLQLQSLRNSRRALEQKLIQREMQQKKSRLLEDQLRKRAYY